LTSSSAGGRNTHPGRARETGRAPVASPWQVATRSNPERGREEPRVLAGCCWLFGSGLNRTQEVAGSSPASSIPVRRQDAGARARQLKVLPSSDIAGTVSPLRASYARFRRLATVVASRRVPCVTHLFRERLLQVQQVVVEGADHRPFMPGHIAGKRRRLAFSLDGSRPRAGSRPRIETTIKRCVSSRISFATRR
jgi:hypothetical protein